MFGMGTKEKSKEFRAAELVLRVAIDAGKVTFALEAAQKLGRELTDVEHAMLTRCLHIRRDEGVAADLSDALYRLPLNVAVADAYTHRMLELKPELLHTTQWKKISFSLWSELVELLFDRNAGPTYIVDAIRARSDIPAEKLISYGKRLMNVAISCGNALALYQGAAYAQTVVVSEQERQLLNSLMFKKTETVKDSNDLTDKIFREATFLVA